MNEELGARARDLIRERGAVAISIGDLREEMARSSRDPAPSEGELLRALRADPEGFLLVETGRPKLDGVYLDATERSDLLRIFEAAGVVPTIRVLLKHGTGSAASDLAGTLQASMVTLLTETVSGSSAATDLARVTEQAAELGAVLADLLRPGVGGGGGADEKR